ncbi:MAG TPA: glutaredoxin family protein [Methanoculleus sp.]|nr:glutaredoxin family protein [Methanoculleus sp.]
MSNKAELIVYTLENCPNCELLKGYLAAHGAAFQERDMMSAEALTEMRINGVFVREAPVLQKDKTFLTSADLFAAGSVRNEVVSPLLKGD